jgi:hypothetical protein
VSGGIIQTAVTNPALRLELDYQVSSTVGEAKTANDEAAMGSGVADSASSIHDEFACLLSLLRGGDGEPS